MNTETTGYEKARDKIKLFHDISNEKAAFIEKVLTGETLMSFTTLEKCRDVLLQINQEDYVISNIFQNTVWRNGTDDYIKDMYNLSKERVEKSKKNLDIIFSWLPPAPKTRRTD